MRHHHLCDGHPQDPAIFGPSAGRIEIAERSPAHPDAARLLREFYREQVVQYGFADPVELSSCEYKAPHGVFAVVYLDTVPAGCGGYRWFDRVARTVEIKKTYIVPDSRAASGLGGRCCPGLNTTPSQPEPAGRSWRPAYATRRP